MCATMTATSGSRWAAGLAVACVLITAAIAVVAGTVFLLDRGQLNGVIRVGTTFHFHYRLIRTLGVCAVLTSTVGFAGACGSLRGKALISVAVLWAATLALLLLGIERSPAHYTFSPPRAHFFFGTSRNDIFPFREMHQFLVGAVLVFLAAACACVTAWAIVRGSKRRFVSA